MRLRKEYLYRKGLEGKERASYERKRAIKQALEGETGFSVCNQKDGATSGAALQKG